EMLRILLPFGESDAVPGDCRRCDGEDPVLDAGGSRVGTDAVGVISGVDLGRVVGVDLEVFHQGWVPETGQVDRDLDVLVQGPVGQEYRDGPRGRVMCGGGPDLLHGTVALGLDPR